MESNNIHRDVVNEEEITFAEIFFHYLRYWKWFVFSIIICLGLGYLYIRYSTPEYKVVSKVVIKDEKKGQTGVDMTAFNDLGIISRAANIDNEIEVLRSKTLMKSVVDSLKINVSYFKDGWIKNTEIYKQTPIFVSVSNLEKRGSFTIDKINENTISINSDEEDFDREVDINKELASPWGVLNFQLNPFGRATYPILVILHKSDYIPDVQISSLNKTSSVVEISMITACPEKGQDIINTLVKHYNQDAIDEENYVATNTIHFIEERLGIISGELRSAERDVENYRRSKGLTDIEAQAQLALSSSSEYAKKISDTEIQLSLLRSIKNFLTSPENHGDVAPANIGLTDPTILANIQKYNEEILAKKRATTGLTATNPIVIEYDDRIASFKDNLLKGISISESSLQLAIRELRKQENMYAGRAVGLSTQERESHELYRHQSIKESLFLYLSQKMEETGLALATATPNAKIVDPALYNSIPVKPKKSIILLAALILSLIIPIIIIYIRGLFDNRIHTREDIISITKAPFIGEIPSVKDPSPFPVLKAGSSVAEKFRMVCSNLEFIIGGEKTKVISVTSTTSGEGKSFFSRNLAMSLALTGKKTLLIDLDMRKSVLTKTMEIKVSRGSAVFLSEPHTSIKDIIDVGQFNQNLDIIPVKVFPPNPAELISSPRLDELFNQLESEYEYIVVDTAPVGLVADAFRINQFTDATIYVTRAEYTYKQSLKEIEELYKENKLHRLTCVLNAVQVQNRQGYGEYKHNYYTENT